MRKTFTLKWTFLATLGDYIVNHSQPGEDNFNTSSDIFFLFFNYSLHSILFCISSRCTVWCDQTITYFTKWSPNISSTHLLTDLGRPTRNGKSPGRNTVPWETVAWETACRPYPGQTDAWLRLGSGVSLSGITGCMT